jgi:hypothetical protein
MKKKEEIANEWSPSLGATSLSTLGEELCRMEPFKLEPSEVPLIIRLTENPKYDLGIFPGSVSLYSHDCIHIILGRGVLVKDEAFVIGFTMGSTKRIGVLREGLFCILTKHFYPDGYKFTSQDLIVYKAGLTIASSMDCEDLSKMDFKKYENWRLPRIRKKIGVDCKTLRYYYYLEKQMFPHCTESQRLL